jgi:S-adenosylmethionine/arginine decarboxylase-like enzyme
MGIGKQISIDYNIKLGLNPIDLGNKVFALMEKSIRERSTMKIVHKHLEYLTIDTPPGFTCVLLLDASHFTCHAYTEYGLLAIDLFTCGKADTEAVIDMFQKGLKDVTEEMQVTSFAIQKRF